MKIATLTLFTRTSENEFKTRMDMRNDDLYYTISELRFLLFEKKSNLICVHCFLLNKIES